MTRRHARKGEHGPVSGHNLGHSLELDSIPGMRGLRGFAGISRSGAPRSSSLCFRVTRRPQTPRRYPHPPQPWLVLTPELRVLRGVRVFSSLSAKLRMTRAENRASSGMGRRDTRTTRTPRSPCWCSRLSCGYCGCCGYLLLPSRGECKCFLYTGENGAGRYPQYPQYPQLRREHQPGLRGVRVSAGARHSVLD